MNAATDSFEKVSADRNSAAPQQPETSPGQKKSTLLFLAGLLLLIAIGIRAFPSGGFAGIGFDEGLYRRHLLILDTEGFSGYRAFSSQYLKEQAEPGTIAKLPPTRFLYVFAGWCWKRMEFGSQGPADLRLPNARTKDPALISLQRVSCAASIAFVLIAAIAAFRIRGPATALGMIALLSTSPLQVHLGQHALIDGFFACGAMLCFWLVWEALQGNKHRLLIPSTWLALFLLVLCKENSFFVTLALGILIATSPWTKVGRAGLGLWLALITAPLAAVGTLCILAGGAGNFIEIYRVLVSQAQNLPYAIMTGDGPWYRYLIELVTVNPIVTCLAIAGILTADYRDKSDRYFAIFILVTYAVMCNVRYAMNLRYTSIWELPLLFFAIRQLGRIASLAGARRELAAVIMVAGIAAFNLQQYSTFFVENKLYETVPMDMLRAIKVIKGLKAAPIPPS